MPKCRRLGGLTPLDPVSDKLQRVVVCAANRYGDIIIPAPRHWDTPMRNLVFLLSEATKTIIDNTPEEQGFIDQKGNFMAREEALVLAKANGQYGKYREPADHPYELFSEDLY